MSMSAADHALEARDWAAAAADMNPEVTPEKSKAFIGLAQVHATLAMAEQQRIANLLTALQTSIADEPPQAFLSEEQSAARVILNGIRAQIREGLGLA